MSFNIRNDCDRGTEAWSERIENLVPLVRGDCLKDIAKNEISVEKQLKSDDKHINRLSVSLGFAVEPR